MRLLILLLGMLLLVPVLEDVLGLHMLDDLFLAAVFIYAAYSFSRNKLLLTGLIALALPAILATWAGNLAGIAGLKILGGLCQVAFLATLIVAILDYIFRQRDVSTDIIAGAIVAYLLMAVMWSQIYFVLETVRPGSFHQLAGTGASTPQAVLRYFSLVTITTVGYGDVTPVGPIARAFANLEAVVGQLYLVIQVAWLVGMHVSMKSRQ
jgi:hypothetical protein